MPDPRESAIDDSPSPWRAGLRAARANLIPGLVLQTAALVLLVAYFTSPGLRHALETIEGWKARGGYAFSAASGMIFCGFLPWLLRMSLPGMRPSRPLAELVFGLIWWGLILMSNDAFYQGQAWFWGSGNAPPVVAKKVLADMLVYTPLWASPLNAMAHHWKVLGYPVKNPGSLFASGWYRRIVLPNLIPNWVVWIPGVTIIYCLPVMLQLPVASLIGCFWALLCMNIAAPQQEEDGAALPRRK